MRYLSLQGEYFAVMYSNLDVDCVEHHLKDLLEGAVTAWDAVLRPLLPKRRFP